MKYKAIFFDRDGTLTYNDPQIQKKSYSLIEEWGGKPYTIEYDDMMALFCKAAEGKKPWYKNVEDEIVFFKKYNILMLKAYGITKKLDQRAEILHEMSWLKSKKIYPEVIEVLEYFKQKGYHMGVISDTSPSLKLTLDAAGISKYFTSFTASSLVGAMKPSPIIFNAALDAQGITAQESLYVDDYDVEADGARDQGFTSFLIERTGKRKDNWTISSLKQIIDFVESGEIP